MHYEGTVIRPPSEANSILLQVTAGCSHNKCTFCPAYKDKPFRIKEWSIIQSDLDYAAEHYGENDSLFLCDGDALIMPQNELVLLLNVIRERLPNVKRIGSYASAHALVNKSCDDLLELKDKGLRIIHMGLESGDNATLAHVKKYGTSELIIDQGQKVRRAGINLFVTVILGIAGINRSVVHATSTGNALSHIDPDYVGALSLMLVPEAPLYKEWKAGSFTIPDAPGMLQELYIMLKNTNLTRGIFYANHASNYLPIRARLPRDKDAVLEKIRKALDGDVALRPEWLRGL